MQQFTRHKRGLQLAGGGICLVALVPGLPKPPFLIVGCLLLILAARLPSEEQILDQAVAAEAAEAEEVPLSPDAPERIASDMRVEPLELEIAFDLVDLVDSSKGGDLLDRVRALRRKLALELGIVIPLVRTRDNMELPSSTYTIRVHGVEIGRGEAPQNHVLVLGDDQPGLPGTATREPVFGLPARWVPLEFRHQAEVTGATVVDRASVITTHLAEVVRRNAGRLLGRQDVKLLIDLVKQTDPVVIDELNGGEHHASARSSASCNRCSTRASASATSCASSKSCPSARARHQGHGADRRGGPHRARARYLGRARTRGQAAGARLEPIIEHSLAEALRTSDHGTYLALDPQVAEQLATAVARSAQEAEMKGIEPVLVCSTQLRAALRRLLQAAAPRLPVLAYTELGAQLELDTIAVVNLGQPAAV